MFRAAVGPGLNLGLGGREGRKGMNKAIWAATVVVALAVTVPLTVAIKQSLMALFALF